MLNEINERYHVKEKLLQSQEDELKIEEEAGIRRWKK